MKIRAEKYRLFVLALLGSVLVLLPAAAVLVQRDLVFAGRDLTSMFLPAKLYWRNIVLSEGRIPLWSPLAQAGAAFYADATLSPLNPLNIIFLFTKDILSAFDWYLGLHLVVVFVCAFFAFASFALPAWLVFLLAMLASWQGSVWSGLLLMHVMFSIAATWLCLGALKRWAIHYSRSWLGVTALALAMPAYGGDPQYCYLLAFVVVGFFIYQRVPPRRAALSFIVIGCIAFCLAAPQLLPLYDLARDSARGLGHLELAIAERASFHPQRLLDLVWPLPFGNRVPEDTYGHPDFLNAKEPFLFSCYLGLSVVSLLFGLGLLCYRAKQFKRLLGIFAASCIALLLSLGKFFPLYAFCFRFLPGWNFFRYPERLMPLFCIGMLILLGKFLELTWAEFPQLRRAWRIALWYIIAAVMLFDLGSVAHDLVWAQPRWLEDANAHPWSQAVESWQEKSETDFATGAARRFASLESYTTHLQFADKRLDPIGTSIWGNIRWLHPNAGALLGLEDVQGIANLEPKAWAELRDHFPGGELAFARFAGAALRISLRGQQPQLTVVKGTLPYLFVPHSVYGGLLGLSDWLATNAWERRELFLEGTSPLSMRTNIQGHHEAKIKILARTSAELRVEISGSPSLLVWSEQFSKHWRAYKDGVSFPVYKANGWAMAVALPPAGQGTFELDWRYENPWIRAGQLLGGLGVLSVFVLLLGRRSSLNLRFQGKIS